MFYLKKILIDNKIKLGNVSKDLNITLTDYLGKYKDFDIKTLLKIKDYLVEKKVINSDFDLGNFLKEI